MPYHCEPCDPTVKQVRAHRLNYHLPFRSWCSVCIRAKGKERDHRRETEEKKANNENALPTFGLDYAFFSEELVFEGDEGKTPSSVNVAIMKEKRTGQCFAHLAHRKGGSDEFVAKRLAQDIDNMGCNAAVIRTDQEHAITDLSAKIKV